MGTNYKKTKMMQKLQNEPPNAKCKPNTNLIQTIRSGGVVVIR